MVQGPSVSFMRELVTAASNIRKVRNVHHSIRQQENFGMISDYMCQTETTPHYEQVGGSITADVLILQAGIETFVENSAMGSFFSSLGYN